MLDRTIAPEIQELTSYKITRAVSGKLSNGIPIHYIRSGSQDLLKLEIVFNAGNYYENQHGLSLLATKMLSEGTQKYSAREIAEKIAGFGAFFELIPGQDKVTMSLLTLNKHLPYLLPLIYEIIHDSAFPKSNFDNLKNIINQQLKVNFEKTSFVATGVFKQNIFGQTHPYGYFISEKNIEDVQLASVVSYYGSKIKENSCEIIVSGMVNDAIIKDINAVLGFDKVKFPSAVTIKREARGEGKNKIHQTREGSVQSSIRIGRKLFTRNHPDYLKFTVLNEVLGGYFGSRLMKNIREDKGLTYGIHSHAVSMANEGYFMIGADVKKENVALALKEIYKEIQILKSVPVGDEELNIVKNYMIGSFLGSVNTPFSLADKFKTIHFNNLTYDYYDKYVDNIKKITANDLLQLADKYFDKGNLAEVVVG